MYHAVIERGLLRWVAVQWPMEMTLSQLSPCLACQHGVGARQCIADSPWRHLFRLGVHTQWHMGLETYCARSKRNTRVMILCGPDTFVLSVGAPSDDTPHPASRVGTI